MPDPKPEESQQERRLKIFITSAARALWPHEVRDLTPWVLENLEELGRKLGLTLKATRREVPVGTFRADIAATDGSGRSVIIENQLGPSDHVHFGQVVLYALESGADVIIWLVAVDLRSYISGGLRPEHQRALERLNEVFADKIEFYGVEVSLEPVPLRQARSSPLLPVITVIVKPRLILTCYGSASVTLAGDERAGINSHLLLRRFRVLGRRASSGSGRFAAGYWLMGMTANGATTGVWCRIGVGLPFQSCHWRAIKPG